MRLAFGLSFVLLTLSQCQHAMGQPTSRFNDRDLNDILKEGPDMGEPLPAYSAILSSHHNRVSASNAGLRPLSPAPSYRSGISPQFAQAAQQPGPSRQPQGDRVTSSVTSLGDDTETGDNLTSLEELYEQLRALTESKGRHHVRQNPIASSSTSGPSTVRSSIISSSSISSSSFSTSSTPRPSGTSRSDSWAPLNINKKSGMSPKSVRFDDSASADNARGSSSRAVRASAAAPGKRPEQGNNHSLDPDVLSKRLFKLQVEQEAQLQEPLDMNDEDVRSLHRYLADFTEAVPKKILLRGEHYADFMPTVLSEVCLDLASRLLELHKKGKMTSAQLKTYQEKYMIGFCVPFRNDYE